MKNNVLNKLFGSIGLVEEDEPIQNELEEIQEEEDIDIIQEPRDVRNKVVSIKSKTPKIVLKKPETIEDDIMDVIDALKSRKIVVMNITDVDRKTAQRMIDYVAGACYALNGTLQTLDKDKNIYIITPDNVEIHTELKSQLSRSGIFSLE